MEKISLWCKVIALISVLSSLMLLLLPESKSKKTFKTLIAFIMIYASVSSFSGVKAELPDTVEFSFGKDSSAYEDIESYEYYALISAAESETEKYFNDLLLTVGATGECTAVCVYESKKISLKEISFNAELDESQRKMMTDEVIKIYGEETTIIFSGEE